MDGMTSSPFELVWTPEAKEDAEKIKRDSAKVGLQKQLKKALTHLSQNPNHPGLKSHPLQGSEKDFGAKLFTSYVQNNTPQAHRILWIYGPKTKQITIVAIIAHY